MILVLAAEYNLELYQMDVNTVYFYGVLDEDFYMS